MGRRTQAFSFWLTGALFALPAVVSAAAPSLSAKAYLVLHNKTGKVLLAKDANVVRSIASITKLQAAMVFRKRGLKLDQGTVITRADHKVALRGARTRLELKWTYRNRDLLYAALLASDNRAVSALGRAVGLSANGLVQAMNELARQRGLKKTVFSGPVGIHHGNKSTAWDIASMVRQAEKDPVLKKIMSTAEYDVKPLKGYIKVHYRNTNPAVGKSSAAKISATKTGFNDEAGYCLATVATVRGLGPVTYVLLGSKSKYLRVVDQRKVLKWLRTGGRKLLAEAR